MPVPVVARSKARVCSHSPTGNVGSNPVGVMDLCVVCCKVSASSRSLFQRSPTDCDVSECDHESSITRSTWPTRGCFAMTKINLESKWFKSTCINMTDLI